MICDNVAYQSQVSLVEVGEPSCRGEEDMKVLPTFCTLTLQVYAQPSEDQNKEARGSVSRGSIGTEP